MKLTTYEIKYYLQDVRMIAHHDSVNHNTARAEFARSINQSYANPMLHIDSVKVYKRG